MSLTQLRLWPGDQAGGPAGLESLPSVVTTRSSVSSQQPGEQHGQCSMATHPIRLNLGEITHLLPEWPVLCSESIIEITFSSSQLSWAVHWFWSDGEIPWIQAFLDSSADLLSCFEVESEFVSLWWVTNDQRKLMSELDIPKLYQSEFATCTNKLIMIVKSKIIHISVPKISFITQTAKTFRDFDG